MDNDISCIIAVDDKIPNETAVTRFALIFRRGRSPERRYVYEEGLTATEKVFIRDCKEKGREKVLGDNRAERVTVYSESETPPAYIGAYSVLWE